MSKLKILFIQGASLQSLNALTALYGMGHMAVCYPENEETIEKDEEHEEKFADFLREKPMDFVRTHSYTSAIARQTKKYGVKYAIYTLDSPSYATWLADAFQYDHCYFFYFDKKEYQLVKSLGGRNVYYLPLAAEIRRAGNLVITDEEIQKHACDISFVGGLYTKNPYDVCAQDFSESFRNQVSNMMEECAFLWDGCSRMDSYITQEMIEAIKNRLPAIFEELNAGGEYNMPEAYYIKQWFFSRKLTNIERTLLIELLAERYHLHFHTWDWEIVPPGVTRLPETDVEGAYKVFYASKINLNITLRSIESGVPQRIFDIMSVGGFVLSNWQEEMPELFEEDKEIVLFKTPEEMLEKIDYYLSHEEERIRIGINGYQKVKNCYSCEHQLNKLISVLFPEG